MLVVNSRYLKKYQHTFEFINNNTGMSTHEKDMEKAHVITDFIKKGFEDGIHLPCLRKLS